MQYVELVLLPFKLDCIDHSRYSIFVLLPLALRPPCWRCQLRIVSSSVPRFLWFWSNSAVFSKLACCLRQWSRTAKLCDHRERHEPDLDSLRTKRALRSRWVHIIPLHEFTGYSLFIVMATVIFYRNGIRCQPSRCLLKPFIRCLPSACYRAQWNPDFCSLCQHAPASILGNSYGHSIWCFIYLGVNIY